MPRDAAECAWFTFRVTRAASTVEPHVPRLGWGARSAAPPPDDAGRAASGHAREREQGRWAHALPCRCSPTEMSFLVWFHSSELLVECEKARRVCWHAIMSVTPFALALQRWRERHDEQDRLERAKALCRRHGIDIDFDEIDRMTPDDMQELQKVVATLTAAKGAEASDATTQAIDADDEMPTDLPRPAWWGAIRVDDRKAMARALEPSTTAKTKKELMSAVGKDRGILRLALRGLSRGRLQELCERSRVSKHGAKDALIGRLLPTAAPDGAPDESEDDVVVVQEVTEI